MKQSTLPDTNDFKYIRIGLIVVLLIFAGLGTWAAFAELESGVPAGGQVVVASNKKNIQHLEGGIIEAIYVKDGDHVKKGDKLIKFSTIQSQSELNSILANYYENIALRDRLLAENRGEKSIHFSKELDELPADKKEEIIQRQQEIFKNETGYMHKNELVANQKVKSLQQQIASLEEMLTVKNALLVSYKNEAKEQSELLQDGLVDKVKLIDAQRRIRSIESDILSNQSEIKKYTAQIASIQTQYQLDKEKFFTDLNTKLSKAQTAIEDLKARSKSIKDKLLRTIIKSPVDGVVMNLAFHTIGAVVSPAKVLMEIVPNNAPLVIEAKLSPEYIDLVAVGHKASMTFPSFQMKGLLVDDIQGEVIVVSPDITVDKDGIAYYSVKLKITDEGKEILQKNGLEIQAGMPVSIIIKAGKQTTLEYLLKPMTKMLKKAFLEQ